MVERFRNLKNIELELRWPVQIKQIIDIGTTYLSNSNSETNQTPSNVTVTRIEIEKPWFLSSNYGIVSQKGYFLLYDSDVTKLVGYK